MTNFQTKTAEWFVQVSSTFSLSLNHNHCLAGYKASVTKISVALFVWSYFSFNPSFASNLPFSNIIILFSCFLLLTLMDWKRVHRDGVRSCELGQGLERLCCCVQLWRKKSADWSETLRISWILISNMDTVESKVNEWTGKKNLEKYISNHTTSNMHAHTFKCTKCIRLHK